MTIYSLHISTIIVTFQHKQADLMEKIRAFIIIVTKAKNAEREKGQIITKFALKVRIVSVESKFSQANFDQLN